jgi:hypothetical protein
MSTIERRSQETVTSAACIYLLALSCIIRNVGIHSPGDSSPLLEARYIYLKLPHHRLQPFDISFLHRVRLPQDFAGGSILHQSSFCNLDDVHIHNFSS